VWPKSAARDEPGVAFFNMFPTYDGVGLLDHRSGPDLDYQGNTFVA